jgi:hypothetical protein
MTREERDRLLARYSSGEIHPLERERLFTEALRDQELFTLLFEEEALNEALADPEVRRAIMAEDPPRLAAWRLRWRWPVLAALAASVVLMVVFVQRDGREPQPPEMMARARPAPVTSIEPLPSPVAGALEFSSPATAPPVPRTPAPRVEEAESKAAELTMAAPAEAPAAAPLALAVRSEAAAAPPFAARIEARRPGGEWQAAPPGEALPAGVELRLTVTAKAPLMITAAGARSVLVPDIPWSVALPVYSAGEHELRVEWSAAPFAAANEARARPMSEDAAAKARDVFSTAGRAAPPAAHVIRFRVQ